MVKIQLKSGYSIYFADIYFSNQRSRAGKRADLTLVAAENEEEAEKLAKEHFQNKADVKKVIVGLSRQQSYFSSTKSIIGIESALAIH
ncbi:hypothetical protein HFM15_001616 [Vibrio cholerae]|nr:hypothetical protein [Vibrio cholerae]